MGEGGMQPYYFKHRLTWNEAILFIRGLDRRYRSLWECARWQTTFTAKCAGNKNYHAPEFSWEKQRHRQETITEDDIKAMRAQGEAWAKQLNAKHGKG